MCPAYATASKSMNDAPVSLDDKIEFLSAAGNIPGCAATPDLLQTHHACLFFTDRHVYKMKKPVRYGRIDYASLESRQHACNEEFRLNRRLAKQTYIQVVPLVRNQRGQLELDAEGCVVEWLVKMRRLPHAYMLDVAAPKGLVSEGNIERLMRKLLRFYQQAPVFHFEKDAYAEHLRARVAELREELLRPRFVLSGNLVDDVADSLAAWIDGHVPTLERRQEKGHIRDVHGDLRPEHICLRPRDDPQIIDCLEFDAELRRLDCMEELAFFGMECRQMGQAWIEERCMDYYRPEIDGDAQLWDFYAAIRATIRAMHCVWHLFDSNDVGLWTAQAEKYLEEAKRRLIRNASTL